MTSSEELRFTKIKQLPAISDINDNDIFIIENNTATYKISGSAIIQYIKNHPDIKNTYIESSDIGIENGIVPLDSNKKIDSVYLVFGKTAGKIYDGADGALLEQQLNDHANDSGNPHQVNKTQVGLDQVENKSSEIIRSEITSKNVTDALGYTPELSGAYENSVAYTDKKINDLIGSASGAADTLKELEDLIANNKDLLETLNSAITQKVDHTEYNSHVSNQIIHCSQSEKDDITASLAHAKSSHAREDATKTSASAINGNLKINDSEVSVYQHPLSGAIQGTYTSLTVDTNGHVTAGSNPTVPITRGGTGATSASGALANLGLTATASEINKLDGVSVSTTEINHLSGSTKNVQTQLNGKADLSHGNHVPDISAETKAKFLSNNGTKSNWHALTADDISTALGYVPGTGSNILTAVKGAAESEYQTGNVNITPEKIGLGKVDNTKDSEKSVLSASRLQTARSIDGVSFNGTSNITHYGVCSTDAATTGKAVSCPGFTLIAGASIKIKFSQTNTSANPTLNINNTGAKPIMYSGTAPALTHMWHPGEVVPIIYDGTNYVIADGGTASVDYYGATKLTNSVASTSITTAATPASVKKTYDLANNTLNNLNSHKSSADHDGRYYTEAEVNNLLNGKSNSNHTHDDRYYTEPEINDRFKGLKMVFTGIVSQNTNVVLEVNSAYLLFSMQDVGGKKGNHFVAFIGVGSTVDIITPIIAGNIWAMLPSSGITLGLYPQSGFYNYTSIIKVL